MRKIIQTTYRLMLVSALLLALALPCAATQAPVFRLVATMEELLAQYHGEDNPAIARTYAGMQPLVCGSDMVLGPTKGEVRFMASQGLWVRGSAVLTLDNPNLMVIGPPPFITVEPGATLRILSWNPKMTDGEAYTEGLIWVEEGGTLEVAPEVHIPGNMVIRREEDAPPNIIKPPAPTPTPEPTPEAEPQSITKLWGEVRNVSNGKLNYTMTLPRLSMEDLDAIAIERSADGVHWTTLETFLWDEEMGYFTTGPDSFSAIQFGEHNTYIAYVEETDYQDFFLRLTVEGSRYAGVSNAVQVTIPAGAGPGVSVKPPSTGDYEGSGGNQGGGGQGESDRTGQQTPESTPKPTPEPTPEPTPSEAPTPTPEPVEVPTEQIAEVETPDTDLPVMAESEDGTADLPQSASGTGYSTVSAFYPAGGTGHRAEPVPLPAKPPVETDVPEAEEEGTPGSEPITDTEPEAVPAVAAEPPAVQQEREPAVQTDGDRGGQAALMTLALGGGTAAVGAITFRIKSYKRRP